MGEMLPEQEAKEVPGKKRQAAVAEPEETEIEELDEVEATAEASEEEAPKKRQRKAKAEKPARIGKSTADAAAELGITPVKLRRILRTEDGGFSDKEYTRYDLTDEQIAHVRELLQAGTTRSAERKSRKKSKATEETPTEVTEELESLEDEGSEDDEDLDLDLEDEDEDEEEEE